MYYYSFVYVLLRLCICILLQLCKCIVLARHNYVLLQFCICIVMALYMCCYSPVYALLKLCIILLQLCIRIVVALYGVLFKDNGEAAFSNYRVWESFGFIFAFGYQSHLCLNIKAYILVSVLGLGLIGYGIVEYIEWKKRHNSINVTAQSSHN